MIHSAKDEANKAKEAELWLEFSADDAIYSITCGTMQWLSLPQWAI